ncbi:MAG: hypothetical protein HZA80_03245 [Candidatus Taylorbacteria bacterium]|nr:hypothetical protein [Candidatus Taylorbacteria bacterium]
MQPTLDSIRHVFFEAMASGWAQDVQLTTISGFPGSKAISFALGEFRLIDCYMVTPHSEKSAGVTTIWHLDQPVWIMHYGGWYAKLAIPFLKACLHRAYVEERHFYGGRGPDFVRDERFVYVNRIERNDFGDFAGEERIFDLSEQCFGYHWYRGMSLTNSR